MKVITFEIDYRQGENTRTEGFASRDEWLERVVALRGQNVETRLYYRGKEVQLQYSSVYGNIVGAEPTYRGDIIAPWWPYQVRV